MQPSDWLLAFIDAGGGRPADPVRLQKGLFLLAMSGELPPGERYAFEAYAYGPMSRALYADLRALAREGLVELVDVAGERWQAARITARGAARVEGRSVVYGAAALASVGGLRRELDALSFDGLLRRVYRDHPEFAVNSVFRDR